jgi:hypothetical protein
VIRVFPVTHDGASLISAPLTQIAAEHTSEQMRLSEDVVSERWRGGQGRKDRLTIKKSYKKKKSLKRVSA